MKMKPKVLAILLVLSISGCTSSIRVTGYGAQVEEQHGLKVELIDNGTDGALIRVLNVSDEIISINDHIFSMHMTVSCEGNAVKPSGVIYLNMNTRAQPNDFVIIRPGQTIDVEVPIRREKSKLETISYTYDLKRGISYEVNLELAPYFLNISKETQDEILSEFKVPNYLNESLQMNSLHFMYTR